MRDELKQSIRDELKKLVLDYRLKHNLTQERFATLAMIATATVIKIEKADSDTSEGTFKKIVGLIKVDL